MVNLEAILKQVSALSAAEQVQLAAKLLEQAGQEHLTDEMAAGRRGLAARTESSRDEDWSEFYPEVLRNDRGDNT